MRDKYLTEAMGECWHNTELAEYCCKCRVNNAMQNDFSTWEGFGKLWEWTREQEWYQQFMYVCKAKPYKFCFMNDQKFVWDELIHPDRFADAVYNYLKAGEQ